MATPTRPPKPREPPASGEQLGTLVVVVYRARNLPNKQRIGKQDPYATVTVGHQKMRTEAVKRGGQTPRWDKQLQFEIWQHQGDEVQAITSETGGIGPASTSKISADDPPLQATVGKPRLPKSSTDSNASTSSASSKRYLKCACYADDAKEPDLIGEGSLEFSSIFKSGEMDEWVELKHRGKYAGEIFLEMTFYSSGPPPVQRIRHATSTNPEYGGPGLHEALSVTFPQSPPAGNRLPSPSNTRPDQRPLGPPVVTNALKQSVSQHFPSPSTSISASTVGGYRPSSTGSTATSAYPFRPLSTGSAGNPASQPFHQRLPSPGGTFAPVAGRDDTYNPPYAPPNLVSSPPQHALRPQRASISSFPASGSNSDIASLLRPMSGMSVSKPLPTPSPSMGHPATSRPPSVQQTPAFPVAPPLQHHGYSDTAVSPQYAHAQPQQDQNPHPHISHRHSVQAYLPSSIDTTNVSYTGWHPSHNSSQLEVEAGIPMEAAPVRTNGWQDPRTPSPAMHAGGASVMASPMRQPSSHVGYAMPAPHPPALQPGMSPPPSAGQHAAFSASPQSIHSFQNPPMSPSGMLAAPHTPISPHTQYTTPTGTFSDTYAAPSQHYADQSYAGSGASDHGAHNASSATLQPAYQDNYGSGVSYNHDVQQQQHAYEQSAAMTAGPSHSQAQNGYSGDQNQYQPDGQYQYSQAYTGDQYSHDNVPQQPHQPTYHTSEPSLVVQHLQNESRTDTPYRPLPAPAQATHHDQQAYYPDQQQQQQHYDQYAPSPSPAPTSSATQHQPRFGLPVHQPYDPPYVHPNDRYRHDGYNGTSQGYDTVPQAPPSLPPVPTELRKEAYQQQQYLQSQGYYSQQQQHHTDDYHRHQPSPAHQYGAHQYQYT